MSTQLNPSISATFAKPNVSALKHAAARLFNILSTLGERSPIRSHRDAHESLASGYERMARMSEQRGDFAQRDMHLACAKALRDSMRDLG